MIRLTDPSRDSLSALLALDPFVAGGPNAWLDPNRFVPADPARITASVGNDVYTVSHAVTATDRTASSQFTTLVTDQRAGWLAFAGIGVLSSAKISSSTTHTQSQDLSVIDTVTTSVAVYANPDRPVFDVFYDRVFGGFAFRQAP